MDKGCMDLWGLGWERGDIVEEAVSGSEVKLGGVGLVRGELADSG